MCKETVHIDILKTSRCGDRKMRQPISITKGPSTRIKKCNQFRQFWWTSIKLMPRERLWLATFRRWAKGSKEAASVGATALHTLVSVAYSTDPSSN